MGRRERGKGLPARHLLRQPHNTKRRMRCDAREGQGGVEGVRACAALSIIIVIFGCIHRIVHAHPALCTVAASLSPTELRGRSHHSWNLRNQRPRPEWPSLPVSNAPRKHSLTKRFIPPSMAYFVPCEVLSKMCPSRRDFSTCEKCSKPHPNASFTVRVREGESEGGLY